MCPKKGGHFIRTVQGLEEGCVLPSWIVAIASCTLVVGPIGNVLERRVVVTVLQVFGVQDACTPAGVDDIIESNYAASAVVLARVGRRDGSTRVGKLLGAIGRAVGCSVGSAVCRSIRVGEVDGVNFDSVKGLRSRFCSMSED